jgi:uncharacterized membrane protein
VPVLFQSKASETNKTEVTDTDLRNKFYSTLSEIRYDINKKQNKEKVFEKSSIGKAPLGILLIAAVYLLITVRPVMEYSDTSSLVVALLFCIIGFSVIAVAFVFFKLLMRWLLFIWGFFFGGVPWLTIVLPAVLVDPLYMFSYGVGLACIIGLIILTKNMPKRTPLGNERLGKIRGFRSFLELAEKPKLEELVASNPEYFYDILPFTYVLGVSDKWIKKFETIALPPPSWYSGKTKFTSTSFNSFMRSTMSSAGKAMSSSPSSGSGRSSGGGSSGGGSGGGGGRSW